MCELFAVSAAKKIYLNDYLSVLRSHSHHHPHGWGLAFFDENETRIIKENLPAYESEKLENLLKAPISESVFIGHIRFATVGNLTYENCHPFYGKDISGNCWTVAHNGTVFNSWILDKYKAKEHGTTDSEIIFLHIMESVNLLLSKGNTHPSEKTRFEMMDKIILDIANQNKLNLLVYDGELLYIHTNMANTLFYNELSDGFVFATSPLDDNAWTPLPMMQLLAYKNGKLVYSGTKHNYEYIENHI